MPFKEFFLCSTVHPYFCCYFYLIVASLGISPDNYLLSILECYPEIQEKYRPLCIENVFAILISIFMT